LKTDFAARAPRNPIAAVTIQVVKLCRSGEEYLAAYRLALLCLIALITSNTRSVAANLCTISHVERTQMGLNVYFSAQRILTIYQSGKQHLVVVVNPKAREAVGRDRLGPFRGVSLVVGDRVLMPFGDHLNCEINVLTNDRKLGVEVTLWERRAGGFGADLGEPQVQFFAGE
jgi:hypothetical protein